MTGAGRFTLHSFAHVLRAFARLARARSVTLQCWSVTERGRTPQPRCSPARPPPPRRSRSPASWCPRRRCRARRPSRHLTPGAEDYRTLQLRRVVLAVLRPRSIVARLTQAALRVAPPERPTSDRHLAGAPLTEHRGDVRAPHRRQLVRLDQIVTGVHAVLEVRHGYPGPGAVGGLIPPMTGGVAEANRLRSSWHRRRRGRRPRRCRSRSSTHRCSGGHSSPCQGGSPPRGQRGQGPGRCRP